MTPDQLSACTGAPTSVAITWCAPLEAAMDLFAITTPLRQAAFLANVGHESTRLKQVREVWGNPPAPWQVRYEGRVDLGNVQPGDGKRYLGRGPLQVTGRANYKRLRDALRKIIPEAPDFEAQPELLELPRWGAYAAGMFWHLHNLNELADHGSFDAVCDTINIGHVTPREGDSNGYPERLAFYRAGLAALVA